MDYNLKKMAARAEILKAYTSGDRPWIVTYSGGKDSSVMLSEVIRTLVMLRDHNPMELKRKVIILTSQTHLDLVTDPLKQDELQKIQDYVERYQLPVEIREVEAPPRENVHVSGGRQGISITKKPYEPLVHGTA